MHKVLTALLITFMHPRDQLALLRSLPATLLCLREVALGFCQLLLLFPKKARILNGGAIGEIGKQEWPDRLEVWPYFFLSSVLTITASLDCHASLVEVETSELPLIPQSWKEFM